MKLNKKGKNELISAQKEYTKPFAQIERLTLLRQDNRDVIGELRKVQADESYISTFKPQSLEETTPKIKMVG